MSVFASKKIRWGIGVLMVFALLGSVVFYYQTALAAAQLTITPITWNIIGLDSNKVTDGPNQFPVGARVCNTGDATATNVTSNFVWDNTPSPNYIELRTDSLEAYTGTNAIATLLFAAK